MGDTFWQLFIKIKEIDAIFSKYLEKLGKPTNCKSRTVIGGADRHMLTLTVRPSVMCVLNTHNLMTSQSSRDPHAVNITSIADPHWAQCRWGSCPQLAEAATMGLTTKPHLIHPWPPPAFVCSAVCMLNIKRPYLLLSCKVAEDCSESN